MLKRILIAESAADLDKAPMNCTVLVTEAVGIVPYQCVNGVWCAIPASQLAKDIHAHDDKYYRKADVYTKQEIDDMPSGGGVGWDDVEGKPTEFPPEAHEHDYSPVNHNHDGTYSASGHTHPDPDWTAVQNKPATFPPSAHNHDGVYSPANHHHNGVYEPVIAGGTNTQFWRGDKVWATPGGGGGDTLVVTTAQVVNNNAVANTLQDLTGLSFAVASGQRYRFEIFIPYSAAATTTGSRWVINGPTGAYNYQSEYTLTATTKTMNCLGAPNMPAASNASSLTVGNMATIWGTVAPTANGTIQVRFASEIANSAITALAGASIKWRQL